VTIRCSIGTLFHPQPLHEAGDAVGSEDPHQVVFEGEIEARRTGVALAAGASAQLVVDAPRLVALGRDDVQPAERNDLIVFRVGLSLVLREDPLVLLPRDAIEVVEMKKVDELRVVDEFFLSLRQPLDYLVGQRLLARHEFRVAAEQDVRAAARHVRRDRDGGLPAGLRDDLGFLRVVLRVQDDVLDAAQLQES
jgi:hypothetical protein